MTSPLAHPPLGSWWRRMLEARATERAFVPVVRPLVPPADGRWVLCRPSRRRGLFVALQLAALSRRFWRDGFWGIVEVHTLTSAPELEVWRHRDGGRV